MTRGRKFLLSLSAGALLASGQQTLKTLPQGATWTPAIRTQFWYMDQGSKLMPYSWFLNLECPTTPVLPCPSGSKIKDSLPNYGFIPAPAIYGSSAALNPDSLPIGLARHTDSDGPDKSVPFIGLTCAACHSTRIEFPGQGTLIIEGAPGKVDFDRFYEDVAASLRETLNDPDRQKRFLSAINEPDALPRMTERVRRFEIRRKNNAQIVLAGFGRADAFGAIFNQILMAVNAGGNLTSAQMGIVPLDAPSSYPFLWDISQQKFVQWNGSAPNLGDQGTGSYLRNVGEVLGVLGELTVQTKSEKPLIPEPPKYASSAVVPNLKIIESWVSDLRSPQWPGAVAAKASLDEGQRVYQQECVGCHAVIDRETRKYPIRTRMISADDVQTDRMLIDNFRLRQGSSGLLAEQFTFTDPKVLFKRFEPRAPVRELTVNAALGAYAEQTNARVLKSVQDDLKELTEGAPDLSSYKARPLDGIWATGPFLHNGSVPNLAELLKRPQDRAAEFCVGSDLYDVKNIGYVSTTPCSARQFLFDTRIRGNSNSGHVYGTELSDTDKANLLEYLKTL
jgi:hypothetical protein